MRENLATWVAALARGDEMLVVFDIRTPPNLHAGWESAACGCRLRIVALGGNRGLSVARTRGLELARFRHVLFMGRRAGLGAQPCVRAADGAAWAATGTARSSTHVPRTRPIIAKP
jgi:hypothetical protein